MNESRKYDEMKPQLDLIPVEAIRALGDVLTYGARKYSARNWEAPGLRWGRVYAAALRHLLAWWSREDVDDESGLPHLAHALTNLAFLVTYTVRGRGEDDRPLTGKESDR